MKNVDKTKIRCIHCNDVLKPDGKGTFISCSCGKCAVDGKYDKKGEGYCRIIGNKEDYEILESCGEYPKLIMQKDIMYNDVIMKVSVYKTIYFYDIIISGDNKLLLKLKQQNEYANYMDYSKFGYPILIWDTTDKLDEAKYVVKEFEKMI